MPTGTERLAASTRKILATTDSIKSSLDRISQSASILRAHRRLANPTAEEQTIRDRVAVNQAWAAQAEQQRQQLRDMNARAAEFYGRAAK